MSNKRVVGRVLKLFISKLDKRKNLEKIELDSKGVIGDKFYGQDPDRLVLLSSKSSYILSLNNNIDIKFGDLGENILIDYNPYSLEIGEQIKIGDVVFEISQACTLCKSLSKIDNKLPKLLKNDRGVFLKVIRSGTTKENELVYLIN
ncbi:MAG: MOSC domain-containing protein [Campylobacterota bacterium]|nr:MOSC domain-containing protein [Campylobacterota bacterium]